MKKWLKNIILALAITIFGYLLLNLTFILDALYQGMIRSIMGLFLNLGPESNLYWFPPVMHLSFVVIIGLITYFIFKLKLKPLYKAIYLTVPTAVVLVTIGMFLSNWPMLMYSLGLLLGLATIFYFYRTKQPWLYYFSVILVSITLAIFTLLSGEI